MKKHAAKEAATALAIGAVGYPLLELLWRRRTHPSMALAGGLSFLFIFKIHQKKRPLLWRCLAGSLCVTGIELVTGLVVNCLFKKNVWDYSNKKYNLLGQICLAYSALWALLTGLLSGFCRWLGGDAGALPQTPLKGFRP